MISILWSVCWRSWNLTTWMWSLALTGHASNPSASHSISSMAQFLYLHREDNHTSPEELEKLRWKASEERRIMSFWYSYLHNWQFSSKWNTTPSPALRFLVDDSTGEIVVVRHLSPSFPSMSTAYQNHRSHCTYYAIHHWMLKLIKWAMKRGQRKGLGRVWRERERERTWGSWADRLWYWWW